MNYTNNKITFILIGRNDQLKAVNNSSRQLIFHCTPRYYQNITIIRGNLVEGVSEYLQDRLFRNTLHLGRSKLVWQIREMETLIAIQFKDIH